VWEARRTTYARAEEVGVSLVNAIRSDVARYIEFVDLSLQSIDEDIQHPETGQAYPQIHNLLLFGHSAAVPGIDRLFVLDETGNVRFDSSAHNRRSENMAGRDFFNIHKGLTPAGLYVSKPSQSEMSGLWSFCLSRRLSHADGSLAGVVVARIRLSYFERLLRNLELGPGNIATLLRTDGTVLMRWPYDKKIIGRNLKGSILFSQLAESYEGSYHSVSVADGVERLVVYSRIGDLPLVVIVGQSNSFIYAQWYYFAFLTAFALSILFMGTVALSMYLASELTQRHAAESKLADLAATDSLTGLSNRRHFKEAMGREWQRAMRDLTPLALLMIDTDRFKAYNDTHGHQAGDHLLKTISTAISSATGRGGDIAARYGGDEFAVLLPSTSADGAKLVAERVHAALADLCERLGIIQTWLSIGVASLTPAADEQPSMLVELADKALYRAKELGRNRTEVATRPVVEPAIVLVPAGTKAA
jgi:diguanylate cyclase (GGDEF)-like protein